MAMQGAVVFCGTLDPVANRKGVSKLKFRRKR